MKRMLHGDGQAQRAGAAGRKGRRVGARGLAALLLAVAALLSACGGDPFPAGEGVDGTANPLRGGAELEGVVEQLIEDFADHARTRTFLRTGQDRLELRLPPGAVAGGLRAGARVRVTGTQESERILALDPASTVETIAPASAAALASLGEQRTLVILVNFQDKPTERPWTVEQVRSAVFGTVDGYFREASYQQAWLSGDVRGWYTLPLESTVCDQLGIAAQARQAAAAAGVDLAAYRRLVYLFPRSGCQWSGTGSVGGNPSQAWINGSLELGVVGHELGHNLGLEHSHSLVCSGATLGTGCTTLEYGDGVDLMGWSPAAHFHAFQKERLGWLGRTGAPPIATVEASGDYVVDRYETAGAGPKALKILKSTNPVTGARTWYYVEYRQAVGFDAVLAGAGSMMNGANVLNGVLLHSGYEANGGYDNHLLDTTPETYDLYTRDPALTTGRSFSDPEAGVTITTLWTNGTNAGVRVALAAPDCVRAAPSIGLAPSSLALEPGGSASVAVTVTSRDPAGCAPAAFDQRAAAPYGWSASFAASSLTLGPGESGSTSLVVSAPAGAAASTYPVSVTAASAAAPALSATATASCSIAAPLAASVSSNQPAYKRGALVKLAGSVTSAGQPVAGAAVTFTVTKPNGATVTRSASTDAAGQAAWDLRLHKTRDPAGTWLVRMTAVSQERSASAATSFVVR